MNYIRFLYDIVNQLYFNFFKNHILHLTEWRSVFHYDICGLCHLLILKYFWLYLINIKIPVQCRWYAIVVKSRSFTNRMSGFEPWLSHCWNSGQLVYFFYFFFNFWATCLIPRFFCFVICKMGTQYLPHRAFMCVY